MRLQAGAELVCWLFQFLGSAEVDATVAKADQDFWACSLVGWIL